MSKKKTGVLLVFMLIGGAVGYLSLNPFADKSDPFTEFRSQDALDEKPDIYVHKPQVSYFNNEIRVQAKITNQGGRPVRKIQLHFKVYLDDPSRKLLIERMVGARWDQPELKKISSPREKRRLAGVLLPGKSVYIRQSLWVPNDIPQIVKVRPWVGYVQADFAD